MVFRLPTHLEPFIPPPSEQMPPHRPWRGSLLVTYRSSDNLKTSTQELRVTAVETDGENRVDLWPAHFVFHPTYDNPILREVQAWTKRHCPPICAFLPDRLQDVNDNAVNQSSFRSLSRILFENYMVAIATWNGQDRSPGGSIILYPVQNSTALLVGAIFLNTSLPDFVGYNPSLQMMHSGAAMSSRMPNHMNTAQSAYGALLRNANSHASTSYRHPQLANITSPIGTDMKQDPYPYLMSRTHHSAYSSVTDPNWPAVKEEETGDFPSFNGTHRIGRGQDSHSQYPM